MAEEKSLDAFHAHEVLHTSLIVANMFETWIEEHVFVQQNADLKTAAERLTEQLHDFYQMVGKKTR